MIGQPDLRIISLLPGATEWVCELGLQDYLVGVSHECDFPQGVSTLPKVTRSRIDIHQSSKAIDETVRQHSETRTPLFELDGDVVASLKPNLILTQTLCNVCAVSESDVRRSLQTISNDCELIDLHAMTFDDVVTDAEKIIQATGSQARSKNALAKLRSRIASVRESADNQHSRPDNQHSRPKVTLLEWADPLFCAGHWTPQLIQWAGGDDPIGKPGTPSRQIEPSELVAADPDILLIACCGLDKARSEAELATLSQIDRWDQLRCVQQNQVHCFDGSAWFNRPGPRLVDALEAVAKLIRQAM